MAADAAHGRSIWNCPVMQFQLVFWFSLGFLIVTGRNPLLSLLFSFILATGVAAFSAAPEIVQWIDEIP